MTRGRLLACAWLLLVASALLVLLCSGLCSLVGVPFPWPSWAVSSGLAPAATYLGRLLLACVSLVGGFVGAIVAIGLTLDAARIVQEWMDDEPPDPPGPTVF